MQFDPRTIAREIPGVFDEVFPQLTPGLVAHLNSLSLTAPVSPLPTELLLRSSLQKAMLFEIGYTVGEQLLEGLDNIDWPICIEKSLRRQQSYFDARLPEKITSEDQLLAEIVGRNLANEMKKMSRSSGQPIILRPRIPGLEWISSGYGDLSLGNTLIEIKCSAKRFSSADYRQVAIYWLLSFAASIEGQGDEWRDFVLFNPRSGAKVLMKFDAFLSIISSARTKVEILQLFQSLVGSRLTR